MKRNRVQPSKKARAVESSTFRGRWLLSAALAIGLLAATIWLWPGAKPNKTETESGWSSVSFSLPAVAPSPFQNTHSDALYVGTARCIECHADQHASFLQTAHSRSMRVVDPQQEPKDGTLDHAASGRRYQSYRREGQLRHRESIPLAQGSGEVELCDYPLRYLVGSGRFTRSYAVEDAGFLVESPMTWYESLHEWRMSPGYDKPAHRSFHRVIEYDCLFCHAGSLQAIQKNEQRLQLGETTIGCERCHGPGSMHVARWSNSDIQPSEVVDRTIVNPKHLSRELADAICYQCHLTSAVRVLVRGRQLSEFRPGLRWQDFAIDYGFESTSKEMTVVGHVSQMRQSQCFQASDALNCLTCHAAHNPIAPGERVAHYRAICQSCHANRSCTVPENDRTARNGNDCTNCHMPQSSTDIAHVAFTHHRIGIHTAASGTQKLAEDSAGYRELVPVLDISHLAEIDRDRARGIANLQYHRDHERHSSSQLYLDQARTLIDAVVNQGLIDPYLALGRAELSGESGDIGSADHWARYTIAMDGVCGKEKSSALRLLAGIALQAGRISEARDYLEELTILCRDPRDWFLLGVCQQQLGNIQEAITAFERVLAIDPAQPETYEILAPLYRSQGKSEREEWSLQRARSIRQSRAAPGN